MARHPGIVRRAAGGVYEVELAGGEVVEAVLRGRLKLEQRTGDRVVAGDRVEVERHADGSITIESVRQRASELARRAPGHGGRRAKVIVANLDQLVAVFAAAQPEPRLRMLDRFLVLAEANGLPAVVVVNKVDLVGEDDARATFADYEAAGYPVLLVSALEGRGLDALRAVLCGRISALTGPSGVGKSSLLNALEPGLGLRTAEISAAVRKGRHTTVTAELIPLQCGGYVADTPGLREVGLWGVPLEDLDLCFPEFRPYREECRFGGSCTHTHEPGCAVRAAVEAGAIPAARYESYRALRSEEEEAAM
ncbi:MAG TPA: ribosome small subunit-dependent GTPase A [Longimicrobiales bacterium]